jgi:hypothetical protein
VFLDLAVLNRMRSGFGRVHLEDFRVCTGYNMALGIIRHPPYSKVQLQKLSLDMLLYISRAAHRPGLRTWPVPVGNFHDHLQTAPVIT